MKIDTSIPLSKILLICIIIGAYQIPVYPETDDVYADLAVDELYAEAVDAIEGESGKRKYIETVRLLRLAAEAGHPISQYTLGDMYANGLGVRRNQKQAFKWWRLASESDFALAMFKTSWAYLSGSGVAESRDMAKELLEKIVDPDVRLDYGSRFFIGQDYGIMRNVKGYASYYLGTMLIEDEPNDKSVVARGLQLIEDSASLGIIESVLFLAVSYASGEHYTVDVTKAKEMFKRYKLMLSDSVRRRMEFVMVGLDPLANNDIQDGLTATSDELNFLVNQMIVDLVREQRGLPKDKRILTDLEAIELLEIAAQSDTKRACLDLALILAEGDEDIRDGRRAFAYIEQAAEDEWRLAMYNKGVMLMNGVSGKLDKELGKEALRKADDYGLYVARLVLDEEMSPRLIGEAEALKICENGYEKKDPRAIYSYAYRLKMGIGVPIDYNYKKLFKLFMRAAKHDDAGGLFEIGTAYYWGDGVEQNYRKALEWYEKAKEVGSRNANFEIAYMKSKGEGCLINYDVARKLYLEICDSDFEAMNNLANFYFDGLGIKKDEAKACELYLESANKGSSIAKTNLGRAFQHGRGVEKNLEQAINWYEKAAELGSVFAALQLVSIYEEELADLNEVTHWREVAAENGDIDSMLEVADRYHLGRGVPQSSYKSFEWANKYLALKPIGYYMTNKQFKAVRCLAFALMDDSWNGYDPEEAASLWHFLSDRGYYESKLILAKMHEDGVLKNSKPGSALKIYKSVYEDSKKQDSKKYMAWSAFGVAKCYEKGLGTKINSENRVKWLRIADDIGQAAASYELALIGLEKEKGSVEYKEAIQLMSKAANYKYTPALFWYAEYHLVHDDDLNQDSLVIQWLKAMARKGNAKARKLLREHNIEYRENKPIPDKNESDDEMPFFLEIAACSLSLEQLSV
ncbi:sel1 repeat family protein [Puniceicoccaceae bacterium K14]|nr:sel1 repeat family protein [Puniceicoccaceae bacterium K14]